MTKNNELQSFLLADQFIDWQQPEIIALAGQIAGSFTKDTEIAEKCFEWVRDEIKHCLDFHTEQMTCCASDVLTYRTGFCYAKSHLLAALLRANDIPAGFCYQRLSLSGQGAQFCLHGLNAVFLRDYGWYRLDPRGNRHDINALFCPPHERLAFPIDNINEFDLPGIFAVPLPEVTDFLQKYCSVSDAVLNLPDYHV